MKKSFIPFLLSVFSLSAVAQQQQFSMEEATLSIRGKLAPQNLKQTAWIPGSNTFTRLTGSAANEAILSTTVPQMKADTLLRLSEINQDLFGKDSLQTIPALQWINGNSFYFALQNDLYIARKTDGKWQYSNGIPCPGRQIISPWIKTPDKLPIR